MTSWISSSGGKRSGGSAVRSCRSRSIGRRSGPGWRERRPDASASWWSRLGDLEDQQRGIESNIAEVDGALRHIQTGTLTAEPIRDALSHMTEIYAQLKPREQKELFRLPVK